MRFAQQRFSGRFPRSHHPCGEAVPQAGADAFGAASLPEDINRVEFVNGIAQTSREMNRSGQRSQRTVERSLEAHSGSLLRRLGKTEEVKEFSAPSLRKVGGPHCDAEVEQMCRIETQLCLVLSNAGHAADFVRPFGSRSADENAG